MVSLDANKRQDISQMMDVGQLLVDLGQDLMIVMLVLWCVSHDVKHKKDGV
jgi:hypothetical protein